MNEALCCTNCGETVIKSMSDGTSKLRSKVVVFRDGKAMAVCKGCNSEIPVPIVIDMDLMKSMTHRERLRLYVKK